jgi:hypothetical protein
MAIIPLPERGQPLDTAYIYQLANAINLLSNELVGSSYNFTTIDTVSAGKQSIKTAQSKIIGGYVEVANNTSVNSGNEISFSYNFASDFSYPPIVTVTPVNIGNTPAGNVSVVLKSVTTSRIDGTVRFNSSGNASVSLNLIAIGIPR